MTQKLKELHKHLTNLQKDKRLETNKKYNGKKLEII